MHMNSVPQYLLSEDRQEFERILDEALRSAPHRPELAAIGQRLTTEQLRTMALGATALITVAAATEYQHYVKIREELRRPTAVPATSSASSSVLGAGSAEQGTATAGAAAETTGAGAGAVVAVLAPVLAGIAATVFLLVGYLLKMLDPAPAFAQTMITAGWVFGAVTAAAIVVAGTALLLTALRNHPSPEPGAGLHEEVEQARDAWRDALLERGILPFLRDALAGPSTAPRRRDRAEPGDRIPQLGYGRPGFSSPDDGVPSARPRYTSPDFTSPDFGGPEHQPE
ncbi:hypothetical protein [Streptomyces sp. NPDC018610]|uniref:hypothetical protein n=1 Tax=Streptomyces sp. NPDC018610 TaxID=3365049 RepID=UPI0037B601AE